MARPNIESAAAPAVPGSIENQIQAGAALLMSASALAAVIYPGIAVGAGAAALWWWLKRPPAVAAHRGLCRSSRTVSCAALAPPDRGGCCVTCLATRSQPSLKVSMLHWSGGACRSRCSPVLSFSRDFSWQPCSPGVQLAARFDATTGSTRRSGEPSVDVGVQGQS